jgi:putative transposase
MKQSRFTDEQVVAILAEGAAGAPVRQLCRRHGITTTTYYRWKAQYGEVRGSEIGRLRKLEEENQRLKRIVAEQALNLEILKDVLGKES